MSARRLAVVAAFAAVVLWLMKALAIWSAGGLDESSLESPLFVAGLLALVMAAAAVGFAVTERHAPAVRTVGAVAGVVAGAVLTIVVQNAVVKPLLPASTGWVEDEAGVWVSAALVAGIVLWWNSRRRESVGAET